MNKMTKEEMAMEIMSKINWTEQHKANRVKQLRNSKWEDVNRIYQRYLEDKEHSLFYISLLW